MKNNQPKWLRQKERAFNSTGKLDLSGEIIRDLSFIGSRPSMKILDLSFTSITSLEGLAVQPKLEYLVLDGSSISSFKNASSISNITKISLQNTPVASIPNFKLSLLLVCGKNLRIINGKIIPERIKKKAEAYPPFVSKLIDNGWMVDYPCPGEEELRQLCDDYGVQYDFSSFANYFDDSQFNSNNIDDIIAEYSLHHEEMIQRSQIMKKPNHYCSMSVTDSNRDYLMNGFNNTQTGDGYETDISQLPFLVSQIIKKYGFDIEEGDPVYAISRSLLNIFDIAERIDYDLPSTLQSSQDEKEDVDNSKNNYSEYNESAAHTDNISEEGNLNNADLSQKTFKYLLNNDQQYMFEEEEEEQQFEEEEMCSTREDYVEN